jgi:hypothetical protein
MRLFHAAVMFWALTFSGHETSAQQTRDGEREVLAAQALRMAAVIARDVAALEPLVADELYYCHANADVEDKASYLATVRTGRVRWMSMKAEDMKARVYGGTAVITGVLRQMIGTETQTQPIPLVIRSIEVYVQRNGHWQLVSFQSTRLGER